MNEVSPPAPCAAKGKAGRCRTLVVDNSPVARRAISAFIKSIADLELVGVCGSGAEALKLAETLRPDLVLLDLRMPGMSGDAVAMKLTRQYPTLRVILMTVHDTPEARRLGRMSGAHGLLNKMRLPRELTAMLAAAPAGHDDFSA